MFQEAFPILTVSDMQEALDFYRDQLEFARSTAFRSRVSPHTWAWNSARPVWGSAWIQNLYQAMSGPPNSTVPSTYGFMRTTASLAPINVSRICSTGEPSRARHHWG